MIYHFYLKEWRLKKVKKLVANLHDKAEYVIHHGLVLKKLHRIIKFNQKVWLKSYIDMNTDLRRKAKNDFEKDFFK